MNIETKMDAVERLTPLVLSYDKIRNAGFVDSNGKSIDLKGLISYTNYIYVTNNHFIGKIKIPDNKPSSEVKYWDLAEKDEYYRPKEKVFNEADCSTVKNNKLKDTQSAMFYSIDTKEWTKNSSYDDFCKTYVKCFNNYIMAFRDNLIKLNKNLFLEKIDSLFGKNQNAKAKMAVIIKILPDNKVINFTILPISKYDEKGIVNFNIPMHISDGKTAYDNYIFPATCCVNLYYLYNILLIFEEYSIVDIAFNNRDMDTEIFDKNGVNLTPITIKGINPRADWKPDIKFALGQCMPKYIQAKEIIHNY